MVGGPGTAIDGFSPIGRGACVMSLTSRPKRGRQRWIRSSREPTETLGYAPGRPRARPSRAAGRRGVSEGPACEPWVEIPRTHEVGHLEGLCRDITIPAVSSSQERLESGTPVLEPMHSSVCVDTTQTIPQRLRAFSMPFRRVFRIKLAKAPTRARGVEGTSCPQRRDPCRRRWKTDPPPPVEN